MNKSEVNEMCEISVVDQYEMVSRCVLENYRQKNLFLYFWEE